MEGVLWKWTNYWSGWQTRWFILEDGVLSYYYSQDEVNQGCNGSVKVSAIEINVNSDDNTRMDLIVPRQKSMYLRAANAQERQKWLVALGSSKACVSTRSRKDSGESSPDILKVKKSVLRLYCDLLMQQVHTVKTEATREGGPQVQTLVEATKHLGTTCDTFIQTLEECMRIVNTSMIDAPLPVAADSSVPPLPHNQSKSRGNKSVSQIVRSTSVDKKL